MYHGHIENLERQHFIWVSISAWLYPNDVLVMISNQHGRLSYVTFVTGRNFLIFYRILIITLLMQTSKRREMCYIPMDIQFHKSKITCIAMDMFCNYFLIVCLQGQYILRRRGIMQIKLLCINDVKINSLKSLYGCQLRHNLIPYDKF